MGGARLIISLYPIGNRVQYWKEGFHFQITSRLLSNKIKKWINEGLSGYRVVENVFIK